MFESHVFLLVLESSVMDHVLYDFRAPESFFILFSLKSDVDDFFLRHSIIQDHGFERINMS